MDSSDFVIGLDVSRACIGVGILHLRTKKARAFRVFIEPTGDPESLQWAMRKVSSRLHRAGIRPAHVCIEGHIQTVFAPERVSLGMQAERKLFNQCAQVLAMMRFQCPVTSIDPMKMRRAAMTPSEWMWWRRPGREKFWSFDFIRAKHPELKLPRVAHKLTSSGDVDQSEANYDDSDAVLLAWCAARRLQSELTGTAPAGRSA